VQPPGRLRFLAPALVRELLRKPGAHPALLQRDAVHALLSYALSDTIDDDAGSTRELVGVPLLPLADGSLARFAAPAKGATVFHVTTELEAVLLSPVAALLADRGVPAPLHARLEALADGATLNLRRVDTASLATLLQGLLPREWRAKADVPWTPGAPGQPDALQLRRLWQRLALCDSLDLFAPWPLLPTCAADGGLVLVPVRPGCGVLVHDSWSENLSAALHATGCRLLAPGFPEMPTQTRGSQTACVLAWRARPMLSAASCARTCCRAGGTTRERRCRLRSWPRCARCPSSRRMRHQATPASWRSPMGRGSCLPPALRLRLRYLTVTSCAWAAHVRRPCSPPYWA
jgi:hypothetical protein